MKKDTNANKKICEEIAKGNTAFYEKYLADDINWNIPGNATISGKKNVIDILGMEDLESYPIITIKKVIAEGDTVMIESEVRATTKMGKPYNQSYCDIYHFKNGKIQEFSSYFDTGLIKEVTNS